MITVYLAGNISGKIGIDLESCKNCENTLTIKDMDNKIPYNKKVVDEVPF